MSHKHVGPPEYACRGCLDEAADGVADELRMRRFWGWILVGFTLALAIVAAFVLFKVGRPG